MGAWKKASRFNTLVLLITVLSISCGANLHVATLTTAVVNEPYNFYLSAEDESWDWFDDSTMLFGVSGGYLPAGVALSSNGVLTGTPLEIGNFEFRITAYAIDDDWGDWYYDDDDDVTSDSEWYTLFVTERSTNGDCPNPSSTGVTEAYICLGAPEEETLVEGESFTLDINYFIEHAKAVGYDIWQLDFSISYDPSLFAVDPDYLGSNSLRETATRAGATVDFDTGTDGVVRIVLTGGHKSFHKSGRIIDLPFIALTDIPAGDYDFNLSVNGLASDNAGDNLPNTFEIDGFLSVYEDVIEEENAEDPVDESVSDESMDVPLEDEPAE